MLMYYCAAGIFQVHEKENLWLSKKMVLGNRNMFLHPHPKPLWHKYTSIYNTIYKYPHFPGYLKKTFSLRFTGKKKKEGKKAVQLSGSL